MSEKSLDAKGKRRSKKKDREEGWDKYLTN